MTKKKGPPEQKVMLTVWKFYKIGDEKIVLGLPGGPSDLRHFPQCGSAELSPSSGAEIARALRPKPKQEKQKH